MHTGFDGKTLKERVHLEDPIIDWTIILKWILQKDDGAWTEFIWLGIRTNSKLM